MKLRFGFLLFGIVLFIVGRTQKAEKDHNIESSATCEGIDDIMKRKGTWKRLEDDLAFPDKTFPSKQYGSVYERIEKIFPLFKDACSDLGGLEPRWYRGIRGNSFTSAGPLPYSFVSLYFNYYCNTDLKKMTLGDETRNWVYVFMNYYGWFCKLIHNWDINDDDKQIAIYMLPPKVGQWKGSNVYHPLAHGENCRAIIIGHNGKLPWHTLTKKQYLNGLKNEWEKKQAESRAFHAANPNSDKYKASNEKYYNDKLKPIYDYLSKPAEVLNESDIMDTKYNVDRFEGIFGDENKNGIKLVAFSTKYFNNDLPRYVPQFIVLYWFWDNYPSSLSFKKQFEDNFPLDKLKAMIDK